jgi:hypothetical protein
VTFSDAICTPAPSSSTSKMPSIFALNSNVTLPPASTSRMMS